MILLKLFKALTMQTTEVVLTETPQAINVPDIGARIQSIGGLYFKWVASDQAPIDLTIHVKDNDVWINQLSTIYIWGINGQAITVTK